MGLPCTWLGEEALHEALVTLVAASASMTLVRGQLVERNAAEKTSEKAATAAHHVGV